MLFPLLPQAVFTGAACNLVHRDQQYRINYRVEQSDGRGEAVLGINQTGPVDEGRDDIG